MSGPRCTARSSYPRNSAPTPEPRNVAGCDGGLRQHVTECMAQYAESKSPRHGRRRALMAEGAVISACFQHTGGMGSAWTGWPVGYVGIARCWAMLGRTSEQNVAGNWERASNVPGQHSCWNRGAAFQATPASMTPGWHALAHRHRRAYGRNEMLPYEYARPITYPGAPPLDSHSGIAHSLEGEVAASRRKWPCRLDGRQRQGTQGARYAGASGP